MFRFVEHTGEVELEIEASTPAAVLEEAVVAFGQLVRRDGDEERTRVSRDVAVEADDLPGLLVGVLDELVLLADTVGLRPVAAAAVVRDCRARVTATGPLASAAPLVKAATLHRLLFEPHQDGWRARVVLDV